MIGLRRLHAAAPNLFQALVYEKKKTIRIFLLILVVVYYLIFVLVQLVYLRLLHHQLLNLHHLIR